MTETDLESHWMPYTGNRQFKSDPRMIVGAEGIYYIDDSGRRILDGLSGLWCSGAGHNRPEITAAVTEQLQTLDYSPSFQFGQPKSFELANKIKSLMLTFEDLAQLDSGGVQTLLRGVHKDKLGIALKGSFIALWTGFPAMS